MFSEDFTIIRHHTELLFWRTKIVEPGRDRTDPSVLNRRVAGSSPAPGSRLATGRSGKGMHNVSKFGTYRASAAKSDLLSAPSDNPATIRICSFRRWEFERSISALLLPSAEFGTCLTQMSGNTRLPVIRQEYAAARPILVSHFRIDVSGPAWCFQASPATGELRRLRSPPSRLPTGSARSPRCGRYVGQPPSGGPPNAMSMCPRRAAK